MAADQKRGGRRQATIVFLDESGFVLQPLYRRTWALTGSRPQQYAWDRHDRLSVIGSLAVSPRRLQARGASWLSVEWLPAYAPDLNPVEAPWSHAKYTTLANFVDHLEDAVIEAVGNAHFNPPLLRSFFHAAKLTL